MQLDVCTPWGISHREAEEALRVTALWLKRAKSAWEKICGAARGDGNAYQGQLFAIVQGNFFKDLRDRSVESVIDSDTPGIAIGGLSVGEEEPVFLEYLSYTASLLPPEKPRYVMGIGTPQYILGAIEQGIDMFDCVLPTRTARNGHVFSRSGSYNIKRAENRLDFGPIDKECGCEVCRNYSRAYLRHLFKTREILCSMLATYHNLYFLYDLVEEARKAIMEDRFLSFKTSFLETYSGGAGK
jgi:queuine tRNA-ribosyltransferase